MAIGGFQVGPFQTNYQQEAPASSGVHGKRLRRSRKRIWPEAPPAPQPEAARIIAKAAQEAVTLAKAVREEYLAGLFQAEKFQYEARYMDEMLSLIESVERLRKQEDEEVAIAMLMLH